MDEPGYQTSPKRLGRSFSVALNYPDDLLSHVISPLSPVNNPYVAGISAINNHELAQKVVATKTRHHSLSSFQTSLRKIDLYFEEPPVYHQYSEISVCSISISTSISISIHLLYPLVN